MTYLEDAFMHWSKTPEADSIRQRISEKKLANPTRYWLGKSHSLETRLKISETKRSDPNTPRGEANHQWKGGKEPEDAKQRRYLLYEIWREAVFARDDFKCCECGKSVDGLARHAHHIKSFRTHPELRYAIDNGQTLCSSCHPKVECRERRASGLPVGGQCKPRKRT